MADKETKWEIFFKKIIALIEQFTNSFDRETAQLLIGCTTGIILGLGILLIISSSLVSCSRISHAKNDKLIENGYVENIYQTSNGYTITVWQKSQIDGMLLPIKEQR